MSTLLSARDIRAIAADIGLRPTKTRGQNFVIDPNTVRSIVRAATLAESMHVVEVGPGLGSLTLGLLEAGHRVTAVEIDTLLAKRLEVTLGERTPEPAWEVITADALHITELPGSPRALVANLPYNVAVPVLLHFLATFPSLETVVVMVQSEVADRLVAAPGSRTYGVPSVKAQWYGSVSRVGTVSPSVFWPRPRVESGLVRLVRHRQGEGGTDPGDEVLGAELRMSELQGNDQFRVQLFKLIDAAFSARRKTLRVALSHWAGSSVRAEEILTAAKVDPQARGEILGIEDYVRICAHGVTRTNSYEGDES